MSITFKSQFGEYHNCEIMAGYYPNGNLALEIWSREEGCISRITVNPGVKIPIDYIAIKDYSENEGMVNWLKSMDMIEPEPTNLIRSGWVSIPVHKLTDHGKKLIGIVK